MPASRTTLKTRYRSGRELIERLRDPSPLVAIELRPPRKDPGSAGGVDHWIDMYHAVRHLAGDDTLVFTTDSAVGAPEEESLRHLTANLGADADLSRVLPFLTTKHSMEYCLRFPARAVDAGHRALVILGGDRHRGPDRCVEHAVELRRELRARFPGLALGGWANPHREPGWQVELLKKEEGVTDFFLTQVVSHHDLSAVEKFLIEAERQELRIPALFGVFYYRSANPRTLDILSTFLPVPVAGIRNEMGDQGLSAEAVCDRTLRGLAQLGIRHVYVCNLSPGQAALRMGALRRRFAA